MNHLETIKDSCIYPGTYTEIPERNALFKTKYKKNKTLYNYASAVMSEENDTYKLQIKVPVVEKENLHIEFEEFVLFISVIEHEIVNKRSKQKNESIFIKNMIINYFILPENANMEFVRVDFTIGLVTLYIPKITNSIIKEIKDIVVY